MLFKFGEFVGAAGRKLPFKIDCDALDADDWACIAAACVPYVPPFYTVHGVPRGGLAFADAMFRYATADAVEALIVDDVWTTGGSMTRFASTLSAPSWHGLVAFSRGPLPSHVRTFAALAMQSGT